MLSHGDIDVIMDTICQKFRPRKGDSFQNSLRRSTSVLATPCNVAKALERAEVIVDNWLLKELPLQSLSYIPGAPNPIARKKKGRSPTIDYFWKVYVKYNKNHANGANGWKPVTVKNKQHIYNKWIQPCFGNKALNEVKVSNIEDWLNNMKNSTPKLSFGTIKKH